MTVTGTNRLDDDTVKELRQKLEDSVLLNHRFVDGILKLDGARKDGNVWRGHQIVIVGVEEISTRSFSQAIRRYGKECLRFLDKEEFVARVALWTDRITLKNGVQILLYTGRTIEVVGNPEITIFDGNILEREFTVPSEVNLPKPTYIVSRKSSSPVPMPGEQIGVGEISPVEVTELEQAEEEETESIEMPEPEQRDEEEMESIEALPTVSSGYEDSIGENQGLTLIPEESETGGITEEKSQFTQVGVSSDYGDEVTEELSEIKSDEMMTIGAVADNDPTQTEHDHETGFVEDDKRYQEAMGTQSEVEKMDNQFPMQGTWREANDQQSSKFAQVPLSEKQKISEDPIISLIDAKLEELEKETNEDEAPIKGSTRPKSSLNEEDFLQLENALKKQESDEENT